MARNHQLDQICRLSKYLATLCVVLALALPVCIAIAWTQTDAAELGIKAGLGLKTIQQALSGWQRICGALLTAVPAGMLIVGLLHARACFRLFAAGRYFELATVRHLRGLAAWTGASIISSVPASAALSVLLTLQNGPGHRQLTLGISSSQILLLFFAALVWVIAAVMARAADLAEEHAQFV